MSLDELAKAIKALSDAEKSELFKQITFSELESRMAEKQVVDKAQFSQQFTKELTEELQKRYENGEFSPLAI